MRDIWAQVDSAGRSMVIKWGSGPVELLILPSGFRSTISYPISAKARRLSLL